ncbi:MAG: alanine--tRNA ligase [Acidimicrobiales bacterium]|nr:MAG: alanine--tRNA ligase [Acidimicrobiales bacterium]
MDAPGLRQAFTRYFAERGHAVLPSVSLIPHHPAAPMLTNAGMNQFIPVFLGEEAAPAPRATTIQKCFRTVDLDVVGTDTSHLTFFEMLGNFSFGDYFKELAITMAWEVVTEVLGIDPDQLWVTVHEDDDESEVIWKEAVGVGQERIQRMGSDNFWKMADTGPCGPCSEIYVDRGRAHGASGGPAHGGPQRYVEIWNLVFMQYNRMADGSLVDLPSKNIDTGAGLERILPILEGRDSAFDTDVLAPVLGAVESMTGRRYGSDPTMDVGLRILADHARAMAFLASDGVLPSNEGRGYVLRRVVRRATLRAFQLGARDLVTPGLVAAVIAIMEDAYPKLGQDRELVTTVVTREEEGFRRTLRAGSAILDEELAKGPTTVAGEVAFRLHDTFGFPIDLTREIAGDQGVEVDMAGFESAMAAQRSRARAAVRAGLAGTAGDETYRRLLDEAGTTEFTGYQETSSSAHVLDVLATSSHAASLPNDPPRDPPENPTVAHPGSLVEIFLDRTPFYSEAGGQVGDTGTISTASGRAVVMDTTYALSGLVRHRARVVEGHLQPGQMATATIDQERRDSIRRNHTGTHLLHGALRRVLGPQVKQQGSLVAPDRLRFDFSHHERLTPDQLAQVEDLVNQVIMANHAVRVTETSRAEAERRGAIAFFGEKYGEVVRVVEAGPDSVELCGGTHVDALGMIGPISIVSEGSIGAGIRRIEALTGEGSFGHIRATEATLARAAQLLGAPPQEVPDRIEALRHRQEVALNDLKALRSQLLADEGSQLVRAAVDGVVVVRRDGLAQDQLRQLAVRVRNDDSVRAVVVIGTPEGQRVALVAAVARDSGLVASDLLAPAARIVGGGGGRGGELALAGGRDPAHIDDALDAVRALLADPPAERTAVGAR